MLGRILTLATNATIFGCVLMTASGCVQTLSKEVEFNSPIDQDKAYYDILTRYTRETKVFRNFETVYTVASTYLSPEFRTILAKRYEDLFEQPQPVLEEATSKAGFFITIYGPDKEAVDLTDTHLWSILLQVKDQTLKPILIKRLNDKDRWRPFFEYMHPWSHEFLLLFDTASITPNDPSMVDKTSLSLLLASADAKVHFNW